MEAYSQVVDRLPTPSVIEEVLLPASAFSQITAAGMPSLKINWDGEPLEIPESETPVEESHSFSAISIILICMIFVVCLVIAYINRDLLIEKFKKNCLRMKKEKEKPCVHEESMVAAN